MPASSSVAERIRGRASAAPLPSPSRRSRSNSGSSPSCSITTAWPGSADRWLAINRGPVPGAMVAATSAAAPVMNPSRTTGVRASAAARIAPTSAAISNPPTAASAPIGSSAPGRCRSSASSITDTFRRTASASRPVPRPVTSAGGRPVSAATSALAAVVFPMPISPTAIVSIPPAISSSTIRRPTSMAASASSRRMAGSTVMSRVPAAIRARTRRAAPGAAGFAGGPSPSTPTTPTSTTTSSAPAASARTLMAAPPRTKLATICAVTSLG